MVCLFYFFWWLKIYQPLKLWKEKKRCANKRAGCLSKVLGVTLRRAFVGAKEILGMRVEILRFKGQAYEGFCVLRAQALVQAQVINCSIKY